MGGTCSMLLSYKKFIQNFVVNTEEKRPIGRFRCRWEDNIKINLK
jgi:hypothetical protein